MKKNNNKSLINALGIITIIIFILLITIFIFSLLINKKEDKEAMSYNQSKNNNNFEQIESIENILQEDTSSQDTFSDEENTKESLAEEKTEDIIKETTIETTTENTTDSASKTIESSSNETEESVDIRERVKVKGIYVTGPVAGSTKMMNNLIDLVEETELNAMVIDIKNDAGEVTYKMDVDLVKELRTSVRYVSDMESLVKELKEKGIYTIARIVAFKDPLLAKSNSDLSIKTKDGNIWNDRSGMAWVNPYNKDVWDYIIDIAKEAAVIGFDEIQFDYIRFSTDSGLKNADFGPEQGKKTRTDIITEFTKYACKELKPLGVFVSADVYGIVIDSKIDADIVGQDYKEMSKYLDYICPMIYPSHYGDGSFGIDYPDLHPYNIILNALKLSKKVLISTDENKESLSSVRPWLQDFTATWLKQHKKYTKKEIRQQIDAVYDSGYEEWILWNGSNNYTKDGLLSK